MCSLVSASTESSLFSEIVVKTVETRVSIDAAMISTQESASATFGLEWPRPNSRAIDRGERAGQTFFRHARPRKRTNPLHNRRLTPNLKLRLKATFDFSTFQTPLRA